MPSDSEGLVLTREQFNEILGKPERFQTAQELASLADAYAALCSRLAGVEEERDRLGSERAKAQAQLVVAWGERNEARAERDRLRGQLALAREGLARIVTPTFVDAFSDVSHPTRHECRMTARETLDAIEAHDG